MPKMRTKKRSAVDSSERGEKRQSKKPSSRAPINEKKTGLTLAIRFCDDITKKGNDEEAEVKYATVEVKISLNGTDNHVNLEDKKLPQIKDLTYTGTEVML